MSDVNKERPGSLIPEKSLRHFSGEPRTCQPKVFVKTFGCQMEALSQTDFTILGRGVY